MIIAIRLRSGLKARSGMLDALKMLRMDKKHNAVVLNETPSIKGMLMKVKDYITWGEISDEMLKQLILKRGRKEGNARLTEKEALDAFEKIKKGEKPIKPVFCLTPPSGGFKKSIKEHYPNGELGKRKENIDDFVKAMI